MSSDGSFSMIEHRTVAVLYYIIGVLGVTGNAISILIFSRENAIAGSRARLHVHIAVANIMITLGSFFAGASSFFGRWLFGSLGCQIYGVETYTGGMAGVTLAAMLCYQRMASQPSAEKYDRSGNGTLLCTMGWLYSLCIAIGPLFGWNSYVAESSGTACGLNWKSTEWSHQSMLVVLPVVNTVLLCVAILSMRSAISEQTNEKACDGDWFTNKQLNYIAVSLISISSLGFTPYFYFAVWSQFNHATQMTMLASVVPPIVSKAAIILHPLPYIIASEKFRKAFASYVIGSSTDASKKSE